MKYKKELSIAIAVILVTVGKQIRLNEIRENILGKSIIQQEKIKDETNISQMNYYKWIKYREEEKKEGKNLYCMEDLMPEFNKPAEWRDFFLIKEIPNGFYLKETSVQEMNGWTITYCFENNQEKGDEVYFIQSENNSLKEKNFLNGRKMEANKYYIGNIGDYNIICWIENDITIYLKTNLSRDILENLAKEVVSYYDVELNYSH